MLKRFFGLFVLGFLIAFVGALICALLYPDSLRTHSNLYGRVLALALTMFSLAFTCIAVFTFQNGYYYLGGSYRVTPQENPFVLIVGVSFLFILCVTMLVFSIYLQFHPP